MTNQELEQEFFINWLYDAVSIKRHDDIEQTNYNLFIKDLHCMMIALKYVGYNSNFNSLEDLWDNHPNEFEIRLFNAFKSAAKQIFDNLPNSMIQAINMLNATRIGTIEHPDNDKVMKFELLIMMHMIE